MRSPFLRGRFVMGLALLFCGGLTHHRNGLWADPIALWADTVAKSPWKPRAHAGLGYELQNHHRFQEALAEYGKVYDLSFDSRRSGRENELGQLQAQLNIAYILQVTHNDEQAELYLRHAFAAHPDFPGFGVGLSAYAIDKGHFREALAILNASIEGLNVYPTLADQWAGKLFLNRGAVFEAVGRCDLADADYRVAMRYPDTPRQTCKEL